MTKISETIKNAKNNNGHNTATYEQNEGKSWPQILAVFAVTIGPFTNGVMSSWSSPFTVVIAKDKEHYNITEEEASYFIVFQPLGMIFASMFFFKIAEILGRKKSLLFLAVPHVASWITIIFARNKWEFYLSRFLAGTADGVLFCTVPPYIGEITTPTIRGYFGNFPTFVLNGGAFFIQVLGSYTSVRTSAYICIGFPVLFATLVSLLPESPYQLIKDGKIDEAQKSIKWLRRKADIEEDFLNMKTDVERQMSERGKWLDLIKIDSNRRALRAGIFLRFSQQFCGIAVFGSYTQAIFEKAGSNIGPQYSSMMFVGLIWILNLFCAPLVEKFGRKMTYFWSLISSATVLSSLAVYFVLDEYDVVNLDKLNWFPLAGMLLWVVTFAFGLGIVPTLMLGELLSASIKPKGLSILTFAFGIAVFISTNLFNLLSTHVGLYAPFLVYGITCFLSSILTLKWVPETKGKTLEEIQQSLKKINNVK